MSTQICFLGIGLMGDPMVRRLLAAGHQVTAWNRTHAKAAALADAGARPEADLALAVSDAHVIISMLEAGPTVQQVLQAALPSLAPDALWIDMSSTQQAEAQAFHAQLAAQGRRFIDAPVSGGVGGAAAGTLAIMAGGSAEDFAEAEPVLAAMGRATLVGPAGSGQVAKLCNQLIVGATINIVAEAMLLAQAAGADPAAMRAAIRGGFAESKILEVHGQRMLERNFVAGGKVTTQLKDQHNILAAAQAAGIVLPLTELVTARYMTLSQTVPQADHSAALLGLEQLNPGQRVGAAPDQLG
ncbi:NAD(P)-dependent oxidoreductase [Duganella sp. OV458]|uniref:NAD(P)-dependent oxidoreductase n=1 Tax=Duganella sp. OV458 TaxID=1855290 RepID=UPI0008906B06|nr:NAD(P)-dependent oxidoreductase [Duganella sp. OV458]SDG13506.1 2-hydroxy-3-oxopropionate reductase [Duganella sp. OV458]SDJ34714.1 2-hydroxy-3-oxopropionate reductase [Duganella sp. OV510]